MKRILFFALGALVLNVSCTQVDDFTDVNFPDLGLRTSGPLTAFAVQVGQTSYNAVIDPYAGTVKIGSITDLASITDVAYTLGSESAVIWPDPAGFVGNWQKEQTVVVTDKGVETAYDIIFTAYQAPSDGPGIPGDEWEDGVIFFDDFNEGVIPDPEVWKLCAPGNTTWTYWFDAAAGYRNVKVENGNLVLTADNEGRYRNGGVRTIHGFPVGTLVEVRARFKKAGGGFPAIWQMPVNGLTWPMSGEIDIMEWVQDTPNRLYHTIHTYGTASKPDKSTHLNDSMGITDTDVYRVYAAARTEEAVIFYVDGEEKWRYVNEHLAGDAGLIQYPFASRDFDIILNYSLSNSPSAWPGAIKDSDLPATMHVDWVKVSKFSEQTGEGSAE